MKVYSISQWAFRAICVLILLLPVGRHWKLLTTGTKARGTVTQMTALTQKVLGKETEYGYASEIEFLVNGQIYKAHGPLNYEYDPGREITVFFDQKDPSSYCIATFSGFYLVNYTVLPIILLVLWAAFYLSFNNYQRRQRFKKNKAWKSARQNNGTQGQSRTLIPGSSSNRAIK